MKMIQKFCIVGLSLTAACVCMAAGQEAWRAAERPLVVSHRGGRGEYDDNAAGGFRKCLEFGIRGFETDVRMTKDNELVIMHDSDVTRTTTCTEKKLIKDLTLSEVTALTLKKSGERVPSVQQVADVFKGAKDIRVEWEMKESTKALGGERGDLYCRKLHDIVARTMEPGTYVFTSFSVDTLKTMKRLYPDAPIGLIRGKPCTKEYVDTAVALGCCGIAPLLKDSTKEAVDYAHEKGLVVSLWMVQNLKAYELSKSLGADTNTSDFPMKLLTDVKAK